MKKEVSELLRLESEGGSKSRLNEQVARSEAECQRPDALHDGRLIMPTVGSSGGAVRPSPPSFLVYIKDNVNAQIQKAAVLFTIWDFMEYKVRIGSKHVIRK